MDSLLHFLQNQVQGLGFNFLDVIIIGIFVLYAFEGFEIGFLAALSDLVSFILSFILGLKFYNLLGKLLFDSFSIPHGFANAFGFFGISLITEIILSLLFRKVFHKFFNFLSDFSVQNSDGEENFVHVYLQTTNRFLGLLPGMASAFVLLSFLLTVIVSLPFSSFLKQVVFSSRFGKLMVSKTHTFDNKINAVFGGALNETINFLTIEPQSEGFVDLKFKTDAISVDETSEQNMFSMINKERELNGLTSLELDDFLRDVARRHAVDMLRRGYFSHNTPEGISPFDRLAKANISYSSAGENLALAPDVVLAMQGFMNSKGHRANILSPDFHKVGIGVIDGRIYGKMFSQEFTD